MRESDEDALGTADVAEPIHALVVDYIADELRAVVAKPGKRLIDVLHMYMTRRYPSAFTGASR